MKKYFISFLAVKSDGQQHFENMVAEGPFPRNMEDVKALQQLIMKQNNYTSVVILSFCEFR